MKTSRIVLMGLRKDEVIDTRKTAMDRESKAIKSKLTISTERNKAIKRQIVRLDRKGVQNNCDSNNPEGGLPDLRQRLVDRKHKVDLVNSNPNCAFVSKENVYQKSIIFSNKRQADMEILDREEEEHNLTGELMYARNGRKVLPKISEFKQQFGMR